MLERLMKLYVMAMTMDVRSPMPHLVGPPGCGKSTVAEQLAQVLDVNLHIINVARLSPLEVEGVQMPEAHADGMRLSMLPATFWTQLREGDIILLDEFLRGFPEVYNALLDILTSRRAGAFVLPKVFILGASNSVTTYDPALEDRLLHIPVADPRKNKRVREGLGKLIVDALGLMPDMVTAPAMGDLLHEEVLPMYDILDRFKGNGSQGGAVSGKGKSLRNLIGQAQLRDIQSDALLSMIKSNNLIAMNESKAQFVVLPSTKPSHVPAGYSNDLALKLLANPKVTDLQRTNIQLNIQLMELAAMHRQQKGSDDDIFIDDDSPF